jgi:hypothetical protein
MDDILCNNGIVITVYQEVALFCYIPGQYFRDLEAYDTNSWGVWYVNTADNTKAVVNMPCAVFCTQGVRRFQGNSHPNGFISLPSS